MALTAEAKGKIVAEYARGENDTGSPEVQVALLTHNINALQNHFRDHGKGPSLAPRPHPHGEPAPQAARLSEGQGPSPLRRANRPPGPAPLDSTEVVVLQPERTCDHGRPQGSPLRPLGPASGLQLRRPVGARLVLARGGARTGRESCRHGSPQGSPIRPCGPASGLRLQRPVGATLVVARAGAWNVVG